MPQHIGIAACPAQGAALCRRAVCAGGAQLLGPQVHPQVSRHARSLAVPVTVIERGELGGVAGLMPVTAAKLAGPARWPVEGGAHPRRLQARAFRFVRRGATEREGADRIIMDGLVCGPLRPESLVRRQRGIARMQDAGRNAVIRGCPEPTRVDSARLLARAALERAVQAN